MGDPSLSAPAAAAPSSAPFRPASTPAVWLVVLGLVVVTFLAYWRVGQCGFVNLDDDAYVEHQSLVNQGFRSVALVWAFTGAHSNNWHPLTTLSHILDCELFGVRAAPMHWENLCWHVLNSVLVFFAWRLLTGAFWRSAFVAALFALHPLHVESVAWISERKDLLSAFFWLLGLIAYARYARAPSVRRYIAVTLALVGALLSKPMAVTFPCTLLLLDFWPLRRWPARSWTGLIREKLPLFALVAVHSALTFLVQSATGAASYGQRFTLGVKICNALVSYARYLGKTFWPESLSPLYHHPGYWPLTATLGALALLLVLSWLAWRLRSRQPWLAFGWLWFLGTLVPVIGVVQVGAQAMADRYMYVPILGVFTAIIWTAARVFSSPTGRRTAAIVALASLLACGLVTARQVTAWKDSVTLHERSIAAGEDNPSIRYLLAVAYAAAGRPEADVVAQFRAALRLQPDYTNAATQLAMIALGRQRPDEAQSLLEVAARLDARNPGAHSNLGAFWIRLGQPDRALPHFQRALQLDPRNVGAHRELGRLLSAQNRLAEARPHLEAVAKGEPWNPENLNEYGATLANLRLLDDARHYLERALWIKPDFALARANLDVVNQLSGEKR